MSIYCIHTVHMHVHGVYIAYNIQSINSMILYTPYVHRALVYIVVEDRGCTMQ